MSNSLGVIYNHPSIISSIHNDDTISTVNAGTRPFFYPLVSERGEDGEIKLISEADDFLFKYGDPNLRKYGQTSYNILNILNNGESVYVLRLLPDNAGYAHAILNVQTKVEEKEVKDVNGTLVSIPNVYIRPTISYTTANNTTKELLDNELVKSSKLTTIDGYKNNCLMYVIPTGRGSYYNKFGFRIYLNNSYDSTYDFRVYNFEVIQYDEYNNASIIEGPFYVSFDPDAMSSSNESMFIETVVNKYSSYLRVHFNESAYDEIASVINPDVAPSHLDILTGKTRVFEDTKENYYNNITKNYEDVHINVHKYDVKGEVVTSAGEPIVNISRNNIDKNILTIDNNVRVNKYNKDTLLLENMQSALSDVYNNLYLQNLTKHGEVSLNGTSFTSNSDISKARDAMQTEYSKFTYASDKFYKYDSTEGEVGSKTETDYIDAYNQGTVLESKVDSLLDLIRYFTAYIRVNYVVASTSSNLEFEENVQNIQDLIDTKEVVSIKALSYKSDLNDYVNQLTKIKTYNSLATESEELILMLASISDIISYFYRFFSSNNDLHTPSALEDVYKLTSTGTTGLYVEMKDLLDQVQDEFVPLEQRTLALQSIYSNFIEQILEKLILVSNIVLLENEKIFAKKCCDPSLSIIYSVITSIAKNVDRINNSYATSTATSSSKKNFIESAKSYIVAQQKETNESKATTFAVQLQDFDSPVNFDKGTDGDLELTNKNRDSVIENLTIKAFKGLINSDITNRKIIPARFIMDANYSDNIKNAMHILATEIRDDIFMYCDLGFTSSPEGAIQARKNIANFSSNKIAVYGQDFTIFDEFTGQDVKVTSSYIMSSKVPYCQRNYGLQFPIAGNKRGVIDGYKTISWTPNETYKELLYNNKINYFESDPKKTRIGSQLTSESRTTPLSNINNVITVLDIKNDVEDLSENYQFEFNNTDTLNAFQQELNTYLATYTANKSCEKISGSVYASDYDKLQRIVRVSITIKFYDIIERVVISLDVVKQ